MSANNQLFKANRDNELKFQEANKKQANFQLKAAATARKVPVSIDYIYKSRLGKTYPITVNGVTISIPVDGNTYMVPYFFADILENTKRQINLELKRNNNNWNGHSGDVSAHGSIPGKE